jgi:hypothetical protein
MALLFFIFEIRSFLNATMLSVPLLVQSCVLQKAPITKPGPIRETVAESETFPLH